MRNKDNTFLLPTIFALALALRLIGINHGFPFIFHPDEPTVVRTALSLRFFPNPGHFDWPHLYFYLNYVLYIIFGVSRKALELLDLKQYVTQLLPLVWNDTLIYYFLSRAFSAFFGALTVIPLYLAGRDNFGKSVGILTALTLAVLPFHIWHSHYALIDVPMLFFASWGLFFGLNILKRKNPHDYTGSGFYIGLAASTKYNGGLTALVVPFAHLVRIIKNKEKLFDKNSIINLFLSLASFAIGFLVGTPYALLDYQTFLRTDGPKGALWQFTNVGTLDANQRLPEFFNRLVFKVADDVGYTVLIGFLLLAVLLLIRFIRKKQKEEDTTLWFLFISGLALLFYVSGVERSRSHYYMIAYPYIILCFAYVVDVLINKFRTKTAILGFLIFMIAFGIPTFMGVRNAFIFSRSDTRAVLYNWLKKNLTANDVIIYNKNNLSQVVAALPNKSSKTNKLPKASSGILLVSLDDKTDVLDADTRDYLRFSKKFGTVNSNLRLGPTIEIYTINK